MRRKYKADRNESEIVRQLRAIPGVTVETGHDDLLVGYQGKSYWFEVKNPDAVRKDGKPYAKANMTAKKQARLEQSWAGHYRIVSSLDQILEEIGICT